MLDWAGSASQDLSFSAYLNLIDLGLFCYGGLRLSGIDQPKSMPIIWCLQRPTHLPYQLIEGSLGAGISHK
jgi:hypothetical protein